MHKTQQSMPKVPTNSYSASTPQVAVKDPQMMEELSQTSLEMELD